VSGRPGQAPAYAGTDFIVARDGRIAAVYLFSTGYRELDLPWGDHDVHRPSARLAVATSIAV